MKAKLFMKENFFTKAKMFMKKKWLKNAKIRLRKKLFMKAKKFFFQENKIFLKSQRATAEC